MVRSRRAEAGFTLVELLVVVLILGVLMAIAIPTFLGASNTSKSRAAQANLRIALVSEKVAYQTYGLYLPTAVPPVAPGLLEAIDPGLPMGQSALAAPSLVGALTSPFMGSAAWSQFDPSSTAPQAVALGASDGTSCWYVYEAAVAEPTGSTPPGSTPAVPAGTYFSKGDATLPNNPNNPYGLQNGLCLTANPPSGPPSAGSASTGTPYTWYTKF